MSSATPTPARAAVPSVPPFSRALVIAATALAAIALHFVLRLASAGDGLALLHFMWRDVPLLAALFVGGVPLVLGLARNLIHREFSSDLLAGISIITAALLGEYLAGVLVVLMLSGGQALPHPPSEPSRDECRRPHIARSRVA